MSLKNSRTKCSDEILKLLSVIHIVLWRVSDVLLPFSNKEIKELVAVFPVTYEYRSNWTSEKSGSFHEWYRTSAARSISCYCWLRTRGTSEQSSPHIQPNIRYIFDTFSPRTPKKWMKQWISFICTST